MNAVRIARLRLKLFMISAIAAVWAIAIMLSGGFIVCVGSIVVSSTRPRNPAAIALAAGLVATALSKPSEWRIIRDLLRAVAKLACIISMALVRCWRWSGLPAPLVRWWQWSGLAVLVAAVGMAIQVSYWVGGRTFWLDEEMIALNFRDRTLRELAAPLWLGQAAPLGWLAAERAALIAIGSGERVLRLMPAAFGVATLVVALWVGRRWMSPLGAAALTLLFSFGQWLSFFPLELKHYSADSFWGLLLPVLGAWAAEPMMDRNVARTEAVRRTAIWWAAAAIGQWFANGALLVTPACALVLLVIIWLRAGWRQALVFGLVGSAWLASFGLHYELSLRFTSGSDYLRNYWSSAMPPASAGLTGTLQWLGSRVEGFAVKPGGSGLWIMFWVTAVAGFLLSANPALGFELAAVPFSLFVLAGLRLVPLYERFSLWSLPALYVGIALFTDRTVRLGRMAVARGRLKGVILALTASIGAFLGLKVCYDIYVRGVADMEAARGSDGNHELDDRTAVRWLMAQRQPGDVLMTTELALPAVWWYGRIPISDPNLGGRQEDGSPVLEVRYVQPGAECERNHVREALRSQSRVLVYFGFRFDDVPKGFDSVLVDALSDLGAVVADRSFTRVARALVVDLRLPAHGAWTAPARPDPRPPGCLGVRQASRW